MQMVRTPFWILERDVGASYFRVRRTAQPIGSFDEMKPAADQIVRAFRAVDVSRLGLLVDLRDGPMRNDPEFEAAARPYQMQMLLGFGRVALLVKTPAGKLQLQRIAGVVEGVEVFTDEAAALAFVNQRP